MKKLTVVVTRYKESDAVAERCLRALSKLKNIHAKVLFLDQQRSAAIKNLATKLDTHSVELHYVNIPAKSVSFARTYGIKKAETPIILFCDVDCEVAPNWAEEIYDTFKKTGAAMVGSKIIPAWPKKTRWYHKSRFVLEFYSMLDLSEERVPIDRLIGASSSIDTDKAGKEAYFSENFGRHHGILFGGEETDLCQRVLAAGHTIYYTPYTYVNHHVEPERLTLKWLMNRAFYGGYSRAKRGGKVKPFNKKPAFRDYMAIVMLLPAYILGMMKAKIR